MVTNERLGAALFGKTRRAVLRLFFTSPDDAFYLRQVARLTGAGLGPVQRELRELTAAGILTRAARGNVVTYQADPRCPVFDELKAIVLKTVGIADVLGAALAPLRERIAVALVFGSFARGGQSRDSDVDVMVVGDVSFGEVVDALHPAQARLVREVNPIVYAPDEFAARREAGHHFLKRVLAGEKAYLIGGDDELGRVGTERLAAAARGKPRRDRRPVPRRRA